MRTQQQPKLKYKIFHLGLQKYQILGHSLHFGTFFKRQNCIYMIMMRIPFCGSFDVTVNLVEKYKFGVRAILLFCLI
jgi:hypothetical protein